MPKESYPIHYKSLSPYEFFNSTLSSSQFNLCFRQIQDIEIFKSELKFTGILGEKTMRHSKSISIHSHLLTPSFFPINFLHKIASRQLRNILKLDKIETDRLNSLSRTSICIRGRVHLTVSGDEHAMLRNGRGRVSCAPAASIRKLRATTFIASVHSTSALPPHSPSFALGVAERCLQLFLNPFKGSLLREGSLKAKTIVGETSNVNDR